MYCAVEFTFLLAHFAVAHKDCDCFCTGCVILQVQLTVRAIQDAVGNRPLHCVYSIAAYACRVGEAVQRTACGRRIRIFFDKKRGEGKLYFTYMTAAQNKFCSSILLGYI